MAIELMSSKFRGQQFSNQHSAREPHGLKKVFIVGMDKFLFSSDELHQLPNYQITALNSPNPTLRSLRTLR